MGVLLSSTTTTFTRARAVAAAGVCPAGDAAPLAPARSNACAFSLRWLPNTLIFSPNSSYPPLPTLPVPIVYKPAWPTYSVWKPRRRDLDQAERSGRLAAWEGRPYRIYRGTPIQML